MDNYLKIQNYDELLQTNIDFFNRKIDKTFYYDERWEYEEDHASTSTTSLIELARRRVFTFNGQSADKHQRSYVEFFIPSEIVEKIYAFMEVDPRVWVHFEWKNGLSWSSVDSKKVALTRTDKKKVCTEWKNVIGGSRIGGLWNYPNIDAILSEMAYGIVISRHYNKGDAGQILLDWIFEK
jgi:hypothetical protein